MATILVVDDDRKITDMLRRTLIYEGYRVATAADGEEALIKAESERPDLVILDWLMPRLNGVETARLLRDSYPVPILMLTARDAVEYRVEGLNSGADDYLVKPFEMEELRARLRALLRRESDDKSGLITIDDLVLDPATHFVQRGGQPIELTAREYALLEYLMRNPNRLVTRQMAENHLWSYEATVMSNVVDVYIRRLRSKIDDPFDVKLIETIRGSGYRLRRPA